LLLLLLLLRYYYYVDDVGDDAGTIVYAKAPYLDPDTQPAAAATITKGTNSAESEARPHQPPVPASHPTTIKRATGTSRHAAAAKRSSMHNHTPAAGLESPEAHVSAAVGDMRDPGSAGELTSPGEKSLGRGGGTAATVPVHGRPPGGGIDMSRQMAKRTEAFEQLSAFLQ